MYYDTEALFAYPNESKHLTLKEVPFVLDTLSAFWDRPRLLAHGVCQA